MDRYPTGKFYFKYGTGEYFLSHEYVRISIPSCLVEGQEYEVRYYAYLAKGYWFRGDDAIDVEYETEIKPTPILRIRYKIDDEILVAWKQFIKNNPELLIEAEIILLKNQIKINERRMKALSEIKTEEYY